MIQQRNIDGTSTDDRLRVAALAVLAEHGASGLTMDRLAAAMGTSRMTLHRRGTTRATVLEGLATEAAGAYREALWPALTAAGDAATRLAGALGALCEVADVFRAVLVPLFGHDDGLFHEPSVGPEGAATRAAFTAPIARLLRDGLQDGSVALPEGLEDVDVVATVLVNQVGWTYLALRAGQGQPPPLAREATIAMAMSAVRPRSL